MFVSPRGRRSRTSAHYMADTIDGGRRSRNMARIRAVDTKPEMAVRRAVHAAGFRYRLHDKRKPGKPDLVFSALRIAAFVHGCFWHQHTCREGRIPSSNSAYWAPKLQRNVDRDAAAGEALRAQGWDVLVLWECELEAGIRRLVRRLHAARDATVRR
jgi:DNA mismatch endonuclease (patch repair protein)